MILYDTVILLNTFRYFNVYRFNVATLTSHHPPHMRSAKNLVGSSL